MHVFKTYFLFVVVPLFYIGVMYCTYLQVTLIELSLLQSSVLVQVFQTRNIYSHFVDGVDIL